MNAWLVLAFALGVMFGWVFGYAHAVVVATRWLVKALSREEKQDPKFTDAELEVMIKALFREVVH